MYRTNSMIVAIERCCDGREKFARSIEMASLKARIKHLTLEDLINSYKYWKDIDATQLPVIEEMIISKAGYLSINQFGYTMKIKNGLAEIGMSEYLPQGALHTDAL